MKENRGISIVELVIVMIIMLLIVSFAVYSGIDSIKKAEATELFEEMNSIKEAIVSAKMKKEFEDLDDDWIKDFYDEELSGDWYIIYGINDTGYEESDVRKNLGLETIRRRYLVNFVEEDIMLESSVEVLGKNVRTYDAVRNLVKSNKL